MKSDSDEARLLAAFRNLDADRQSEILHALELQAKVIKPDKRAISQTDEVALDLIDKLALAIVRRSEPAIPLEVDLWDIPKLAVFFKRSSQVVRQSIVCIPSFPKAIRLPTAVRAQPLWNAMEVIAWAEKHKERN